MGRPKTPTKQGQICRFITPLPDEDAAEQYILISEPSSQDEDERIQVVSITHLLRNKYTPDNAPRNTVMKSELEVIGDDLSSFVDGLNDN